MADDVAMDRRPLTGPRPMAYHPLNLALRFVLELCALGAIGRWGWVVAPNSAVRFLAAIGLPLLAAAAWGVFAVPDDPSRSGSAPVPVPGALRLVLELAVFGLGTLALYAAGSERAAVVMGVAVVVHYLISFERIRWLLLPQHLDA